MSFIYEKRYGGEQALRIETIFSQAATSGLPQGGVYSTLFAQGLAWRKTDVYNDFRRYKAIYQAKSPEARAKAETWFEKVYEPLRNKMGKNTAKTNELLQKIETGEIVTEEEAELAGEHVELMKGVSPP